MERPPVPLGLHHVAVNVRDLAAARRFWVDLLGFRVEWEPDADNLYLTSGADNLALHRRDHDGREPQRLDHLGICVDTPAAVETWHRWLAGNGVPIAAPPKTHRDGAVSFYCRDPDGTLVQVIHHPPITGPLAAARRS